MRTYSICHYVRWTRRNCKIYRSCSTSLFVNKVKVNGFGAIIFNRIQILTLGILYYLQEKRSHDYNPRLGRSSMAASASADDDDNQASPAPRNSNQALFAPRLGKKSLEFSPRLGRSFYLGNFRCTVRVAHPIF